MKAISLRWRWNGHPIRPPALLLHPSDRPTRPPHPLPNAGSAAFASSRAAIPTDAGPSDEAGGEWLELPPGHYISGKTPKLHQFALTPEQLQVRLAQGAGIRGKGKVKGPAVRALWVWVGFGPADRSNTHPRPADRSKPHPNPQGAHRLMELETARG